VLQDNLDMTQREIAERLGVSNSGMNSCLNAFISLGKAWSDFWLSAVWNVNLTKKQQIVTKS